MKRLQLISHMAYLRLELSDKNMGDEFESCMEGALRQNFRDRIAVTENHNSSLRIGEGAFQLSFILSGLLQQVQNLSVHIFGIIKAAV